MGTHIQEHTAIRFLVCVYVCICDPRESAWLTVNHRNLPRCRIHVRIALYNRALPGARIVSGVALVHRNQMGRPLRSGVPRRAEGSLRPSRFLRNRAQGGRIFGSIFPSKKYVCNAFYLRKIPWIMD
ncbi:hypothetical protein MKMG_01615 [Methanogenium sp. MK-MG]|nr:hypothetical protein MKMG_01615 [Methanogenium sp. MK-MG]